LQIAKFHIAAEKESCIAERRNSLFELRILYTLNLGDRIEIAAKPV
jgi:hypothetical protein